MFIGSEQEVTKMKNLTCVMLRGPLSFHTYIPSAAPGEQRAGGDRKTQRSRASETNEAVETERKENMLPLVSFH